LRNLPVPSALPEADRGTFAGLANPIIPAYLRSLGITYAELLPIHAFVALGQRQFRHGS
jgi:pullulanase/glycogen debranching enzyme